MAWRAMPRCNNMSLRRTKSKFAITSSGISETLMHICHEGTAPRGAIPHDNPGSLDSQSKIASRLAP
jgi:hypothetical protein